jgi:hypothetical protein
VPRFTDSPCLRVVERGAGETRGIGEAENRGVGEPGMEKMQNGRKGECVIQGAGKSRDKDGGEN